MANKHGRPGRTWGALFLGAAAGVAFSCYLLVPNLAGGIPGVSAEGFHGIGSQGARSSGGGDDEQAQLAKEQADAADSAVSGLAEKAVEGKLSNKAVMVVSTADASQQDVDNVKWLLQKSGANDAGHIQLTGSFTDQEQSEQLTKLITNTLPAGASLARGNQHPGTYVGQALGSALLNKGQDHKPIASTEDRAAMLKALKEKDFIDYQDGTIRPADGIVFVVGDSDGSGTGDFSAQLEAMMAKEFDSLGSGAVVAGQLPSADEAGVLGRLRTNDETGKNVSTVDSVERTFGRLATVLAMAEQFDGKAGAYGAAANVTAAMPGAEH